MHYYLKAGGKDIIIFFKKIQSNIPEIYADNSLQDKAGMRGEGRAGGRKSQTCQLWICSEFEKIKETQKITCFSDTHRAFVKKNILVCYWDFGIE